MGEGFKAIVIAIRPNGDRRPHVFAEFSNALAFIRSTKSATVIVEFSVETDTLDFYDATKAIGVPIIFSANQLDSSQFPQFGIRPADVVYPERPKQPDCFADYRPRPGIKGSFSSISLMTSSVSLDS